MPTMADQTARRDQLAVPSHTHAHASRRYVGRGRHLAKPQKMARPSDYFCLERWMLWRWNVACTLAPRTLNGKSSRSLGTDWRNLGSVGQLTRHYKDRRRLASVAPRVESSRSGSMPKDQRPTVNRDRGGSRRITWNWAEIEAACRNMPAKKHSALIASAVCVALGIVLLICHPWRKAPTAPLSSEAGDSSGLPTVKESWTYQTGMPWRSSADFWRTPALGSDGTVYALGEHQIFALSASGELKWHYPDWDCRVLAR
jgi:hypothetical protein